jgi:hypothetical protein
MERSISSAPGETRWCKESLYLTLFLRYRHPSIVHAYLEAPFAIAGVFVHLHTLTTGYTDEHIRRL